MSQVHDKTLPLPLQMGELVNELVPVINIVHNKRLNADDYEHQYVGYGSDGKLRGELIRKGTGVVEWIVEHVTGVTPGKIFNNPKKLQHENILRYSSIFINTERELDFLKYISVGIPYDGGFPGNNASYLLMQLMNTYQIGTGWTCNPGKTNTTAGFTLLHFGPPETIPSEYIINTEVKLVAIVELTTYAGRAVFSLSVGKA